MRRRRLGGSSGVRVVRYQEGEAGRGGSREDPGACGRKARGQGLNGNAKAVVLG